jgi:hypothetical protein
VHVGKTNRARGAGDSRRNVTAVAPLRGLNQYWWARSWGLRPSLYAFACSAGSRNVRTIAADSNEPVVVIDSVRLEELNEFVSECGFAMMLFLPTNVVLNFFDIGLAHGKGSIAALP